MAMSCNNGGSLFFFFYCLFFLPLLNANSILATTRRSLHQPYFPADPTTSPPPPPITTTAPFFPLNPVTTTIFNPPPTAIPSVIIPTNVVRPTAPKNASGDAKKVILSVVISLIVLSLLLLLVLLLGRRISVKLGEKAARSTSLRLFPATDPGSTSKVVVANGSEPLYLGTLRPDGDDSLVMNSPYRKFDSPSSYHRRSPDLHPLPPLSHQCRTPQRVLETTDDDEDQESFYSPRGSSAGNWPACEMGSRRVSQACSPARQYSGGSNLTTPSYPSSKMTSPVASKPPSPGPETASTASEVSISAGFRLLPPPSPERIRISPSLPSSPSDGLPERSASSGRRSFSALTPPERNRMSPSLPSSPSDGSSERSASSERRSFSGKPRFFSPPPPSPPPPPKGSLWQFAIPPPPPPLPPLPIAWPPPLIPPPRNVESTKSEVSQQVKLESKRTSPEAMSESKSSALVNNELSPEKSGEATRPKLKPLHWDKVRASSDRAMVWDQLKSSSFQLNEEMIETLFVCNAMNNTTPKETTRRPVLPSPVQENRVLDPKKSQNIAILLRALSVTKEEVCEALIEGNIDGLGTELLETLLKMAPTKEEELKLKAHIEDGNAKLGPAERFLKAVVDIPFAFKRVDAMLYITNFDSEVAYLRKSFESLEAACEELRSSRLFLKLLEAVLKTGNRMNVGTNRGDARAFKLDTLLKLVDVKGTDGKTTLLHFVVQEIIRSEGAHLSNHNDPSDIATTNNSRKVGLHVVAALCSELGNVKKAASMDSDVLGSYVSKLASGLEKILEVLRLVGDGEMNAQFGSSMTSFKHRAEEEILRIRAEESVALSLVKEITEYFHGNAAREEAHPFRIFVIVRDFLNVLDRVCKEIGKLKDQTTVVSIGRHFPVPVNPTLLSTSPTFQRRWTDSDDSGNLSS